MVKTIGIVSLSRGLLGEPFMKHEVEIGMKRLEDFGLRVKFMKNAMKGMEYLKNHPEKRADDLIEAFEDPEVDMILCAIGGDDTYRLLPYLFENDRLKKAITKKIFLGFSDTTMNHFMLNKVGLSTFYGQAFLPDICELESEMLPYTEKYFKELITTGTIKEIIPSDIWYGGREKFTPDQVGVPMERFKNYGFEYLQGKPGFIGKILGGCLDTIYDIFNGARYADTVEICEKYSIFPKKQEWKGVILLLETSEEKMSPEKYRKALEFLKSRGVFDEVNGILLGKPDREIYADEYKKIVVEVVGRKDLPIVYNINVGHALPRCIVPFGVECTVEKDRILFKK
ncbi:Microcin C7 self-immunity protein MccF [Fusobacterium sp. DD29]|uniref:S66 family peptidase n=1 Tax=unclassified Fusobacterium TaxID=2648384 RepID=UPI001B8AFF6B|nr:MULTISPECIES: S66 peptidase family protein [unclassified Fusobacterium]MBR8701427.1 Microcin C7 self-immunity protein MccF [Fusobacterium sp. DD45]MBR8711187.1 Microcin C7 self-immunity protein MccF [Fusobacterium sp. DD28]MBR8749650.1 Microcin C7 self-immunity protein MccF [Fusobacterium sp. DD29]MBR8751761.1 Microcin C7 self-immunity protein MccF [Fusobacterium sp. DD26]MBR8761911.1 Microcin C7 self-immunity protein MccF [Fusobacterium sp. DD25]